MISPTLPNARPPFYRDTRTIGIMVQATFLLIVLILGWFLYNNMVTRLAAGNASAGGALSWEFLNGTAGFGISEGPAFRPDESSRVRVINPCCPSDS